MGKCSLIMIDPQQDFIIPKKEIIKDNSVNLSKMVKWLYKNKKFIVPLPSSFSMKVPIHAFHKDFWKNKGGIK